MQQSKQPSTSPGRLFIMCGLPGSGKTTRAKLLQIRIDAIRLCPDEWMEALSLDIYDEERCGKIEALQWQFGRQLLARDLTVINEWGTWARSERDTLRLGARELGATVELHCLTAPIDVQFERLRRRGHGESSDRIRRPVEVRGDIPNADARRNVALRPARGYGRP